ncbi:MAG TPA: hypothetical protein VMY37_21535 [Thermoguttaceae bacterium]|nr:hypothetical protein [Thermoguttaceae bacterium]
MDDGSQYLFNSTKSSDSPYPLKARRNAYACVKEGARWHRVGTIYEHDGSGWVEAEDQDAPPDLVTDYGQAAHGDYVGPWLFNELQAALLQLHVVKANDSSWGGHATLKQAGCSQWHDTWDEAKADCMDDWVTGDPPNEWDEDWGHGGPRCFNWGRYPGWGYAASMERIHRKHRLTFPAGDPAVKCDVGFYIIGQPWDFTDAINDFHAMGDPIANASAVKWHEVLAADSADEYISPLWRAAKTNTPPQPWCADPITCPPDVYGEQVTTKGHVTAAHFGTKDFAVPGGFAHQ